MKLDALGAFPRLLVLILTLLAYNAIAYTPMHMLSDLLYIVYSYDIFNLSLKIPRTRSSRKNCKVGFVST